MPARITGVRSRPRLVALVLTAGLLGATTSGAPAQAAPAVPAPAAAALPDGDYVVVLDQLPEAAYDGRISGYAATRPAEGEDFDADSPGTLRYRALVEDSLQDVRDRAGVGTVQAEFTTVAAGFSARLTGGQAERLSRDPAVLSVAPDTIRELDTVTSAEFLGLRGRGGLWEQLGGTGSEGAGAGVVIGVIDSGIWPESASFAPFSPDPSSRDAVADALGYTGTCETGTDAAGFRCNDKLIGARYYVEGFGVDRISPTEFLSPRDGNGHGTHTASTAAGRPLRAVFEGRDVGEAAGMAPAARVAAYKACWEARPGLTAGCATSDSVAAIDDAVADGVDVINFSVSGSSDSYVDPVEVAFLNAALAGVFVAVSAGNSGPGASTTDHPSPWLTTVAASTHTVNESTLQLGNRRSYVGASLTAGLPDQTPVVLSDAIPAAGAAVADAALCMPGSIDPAGARGKVVVCDRGVNPRVEKSVTVRDAGGVAMVLVNVEPSSLNADGHVLPTVHLPHTVRAEVRAYVAAAGATARILAGVNRGSRTAVPEVAEFSSRGPSRGGGGDLLKPDISAPGSDVLASVAPPSNYGRTVDYRSGTSMASPHVAGLAALVEDRHPDWSPMDVKSALMTTAVDHRSTTDAFAQGAGLVNPRAFLSPGLVYPAGLADWADFLLGQGFDVGVEGATPLDPSDLNQASIAVNALVGEQVVTRRVRNVGEAPAVYRASVKGLRGLDVTVTPARLALDPGETATFEVRIANRNAALDQYAQGTLTWKSGATTVRSPVVVQPVALEVPAEATGELAAGAVSFSVTPGTRAPTDVTLAGLAAGDTVTGSVLPGPGGLSASASNLRFDVTVPAGVRLARFELDARQDVDDLDLDVVAVDADGSPVARVGSSRGETGDERVDAPGLPAGRYAVFVNAFATDDEGPAEFALTTFLVPGQDLGNAEVAPDPLPGTGGVPVTVTVTLTGTGSGTGDGAGTDLLPGRAYLGVVEYVGWGEATVVSLR